MTPYVDSFNIVYINVTFRLDYEFLNVAKHGFIIFISGCYFNVKQFLNRMRTQIDRKVSIPDVGISRTVEKKNGNSFQIHRMHKMGLEKYF